LARSIKYALLGGMLAIMLAGCRNFSFISFLRGEALATVGDKRLYIEDVQSLFTGNNLTPGDSLKLLQSYVDQWVKQQLKIEQAGITTREEHERIEGMVDDYRQSLLLYEYDKKYIDANLDTLVTAEEVAEYYRVHAAEFMLSTPLVKGLALRFPVGFRQEGQMRLMAGGRKERLQDLVDICIKNNFGYREFVDWTELSETTAFLPRMTTAENARILTAMPPFEMTQGDYRYFLVITDVLRPGSEMPLERVDGTIRMRIITRRKQELLARLGEDLYRSALERKEVTVNLDTTGN
jgi:hypothetical protein